jgi:hypothetical protein
MHGLSMNELLPARYSDLGSGQWLILCGAKICRGVLGRWWNEEPGKAIIQLSQGYERQDARHFAVNSHQRNPRRSEHARRFKAMYREELEATARASRFGNDWVKNQMRLVPMKAEVQPPVSLSEEDLPCYVKCYCAACGRTVILNHDAGKPA